MVNFDKFKFMKKKKKNFCFYCIIISFIKISNRAETRKFYFSNLLFFFSFVTSVTNNSYLLIYMLFSLSLSLNIFSLCSFQVYFMFSIIIIYIFNFQLFFFLKFQISNSFTYVSTVKKKRAHLRLFLTNHIHTQTKL